MELKYFSSKEKNSDRSGSLPLRKAVFHVDKVHRTILGPTFENILRTFRANHYQK